MKTAHAVAVVSVGLGLVLAAAFAWADEPALEIVEPAANTPEEPIAEAFSLQKAFDFLDAASLSWQQNRKCMTCHTNYAYMVASPVLAGRPAMRQVRAFAESLVEQRWQTKGPRWPAEVVATATTLAIHDATTTGKLHPITRKALDRMWTLQREDGGWDWLKCDWPPMESDDHYGVTFAALGVGIAPENYADTPEAREGLEKIRNYLKTSLAPTLHHKAMILWASLHVDGLMTDQQQQVCMDELLALQRPDGGWALASLGDWKRSDGKEQDKHTSDGYGTGFVIYLARQLGVPASYSRLKRGIGWLKAHQRKSGRWFTRSLNKDSKHFITHAGSAFAMLALDACGEIPKRPLAESRP